MKSKYLIYHNGHFRMMTNPDLNEVQGVVIENPDLSRVQGIPPQFWKLAENGDIYPMNKNERGLVEKVNKINQRNAKIKNEFYSHWHSVLFFIVGFLFCLFMFKYIKG